MKLVPSSGPTWAKIAIVGEAPGADEEHFGKPFIGASGALLDEMLADAGLNREEIFITNCYKYRPERNDITRVFSKNKKEVSGEVVPYRNRWATPEFVTHAEAMLMELREVKPNVVLALGDTATYVLTGKDGITNWRGSELLSDVIPGLKVIPCFHPAAILRMYSWKWITISDFRRAKRESEYRERIVPNYQFVLRPSFEQVERYLYWLEQELNLRQRKLSVDIETRGGKIACLGIAHSASEAICIPFLAIGRLNGYWDPDQAVRIVKMLRRVLMHPNALIIGQNFLFDNQYISKWFGFAPRPWMDTMIAFHTIFLRAKKSLDFICSLLNEHYVYWKEDGKLWDPRKQSENDLWFYNCEDCCRTYEAAESIEKLAASFNLTQQVEFEMQLFMPVLRMMLRGVRFNDGYKEELKKELNEGILVRQEKINYLAGRPLNPESPKQLQNFFYENLGMSPIRNRKTQSPSTDEEALETLGKREPIVRRLCHTLIQSRQLRNSLSVVETPLDSDGRLRCSYSIAGTATTRFSSSANAFGSGTNLQNWTKGVAAKDSPTGLALPNLRRLLVPDAGKVLVEADLQRADLQVVVWESDDRELKQALFEELDIHSVNAIALFNLQCEVEHVKERYPKQRHIAKIWVHGTDYGGSARTMAAHAGISVAESERLQQRWFNLHPGILEWHRKVGAELRATGSVSNRFGFRCFFFDRLDGALSEALAWIPQSTVARVINGALISLDERHADKVEILLQTHDSLTFQIAETDYLETLRTIYPDMLVPVPYDDPLVIGLDFSVSSKSWGDVKEVKFELPAREAAA